MKSSKFYDFTVIQVFIWLVFFLSLLMTKMYIKEVNQYKLLKTHKEVGLKTLQEKDVVIQTLNEEIQYSIQRVRVIKTIYYLSLIFISFLTFMLLSAYFSIKTLLITMPQLFFFVFCIIRIDKLIIILNGDSL